MNGKGEKSEQRRADFETLEGESRLENRGDEDGPVKLDGFASRVARKKIRVSPCVMSYTSRIFSAWSLNGSAGTDVQAVEAEEGRDEEDGKKKEKPIRYTDFTDF